MPALPFHDYRLPGALRGPGPSRHASQQYPAAFLRVGTIDQSGYLQDKSLTLTLNTFDFTLIDPVTRPVVGDRAFLSDPEWDGVVVKVSSRSVNSTTYVTIAASNAYEATAAAAPFGLSDTPNNATTYGYADLVINRSRTDSGDEVSGSCTVFQEGLRPGMTFYLTSVNEGLSAAEFTVQDATVTWTTPSATATKITFGDPIVSMSVWLNTVGNAGEIAGTRITDGSVTTPKLAANSVTAAKIAAGTITATEIDVLNLSASQLTLSGPGGETALSSGGFGSTWRRFITTGLYNSDFYAAPPDTTINISDPSNTLPWWTLTQSSGTAITAKSIADATTGSGRVIRFTMAAGAANDKTYLEQIVPVSATNNRAFSFTPYGYVEPVSGSADCEIGVEFTFLRNDGTTTTGSTYTAYRNTSPLGAGELGFVGAANTAPPADAYYIRVRYAVRRRSGGSNAATATVDLVETSLISAAPRVHVPEITTPATYTRGSLSQRNGSLQISPHSISDSGTGYTPSLYVAVNDTNGLKLGYTSICDSVLRFTTAGDSATTSAFPATPTSGDIFWRGDLAALYYYDGTRWLSAQQYTLTGGAIGAAAGAVVAYLAPPDSTTTIWIEQIVESYYVQTTNNGTNYWTLGVYKYTSAAAATAIVNPNTSAKAANTIYVTETSVGAVYDPAAHPTIGVTPTIGAGAPGTLNISATIVYRKIAT